MEPSRLNSLTNNLEFKEYYGVRAIFWIIVEARNCFVFILEISAVALEWDPEE